jgi:hypothetical protein
VLILHRSDETPVHLAEVFAFTHLIGHTVGHFSLHITFGQLAPFSIDEGPPADKKSKRILPA